MLHLPLNRGLLTQLVGMTPAKGKALKTPPPTPPAPAELAPDQILSVDKMVGTWKASSSEAQFELYSAWSGLREVLLSGPQAASRGLCSCLYPHLGSFEFAYDGGGLGKGGNGTLFVNVEKVAERRIEHTASVIFSPDETADVGVDEATKVTDDYKERDNQFTGRIGKVTVEVK